jgi:hypothetical protein
MLCHLAGIPGYMHDTLVTELRSEFSDCYQIIDLEKEFDQLRKKSSKMAVVDATKAAQYSTPVVAVGSVHCHFDLKVKIALKAAVRIYLKLDEKDVPARSIAHYLDNYREEIIEGEFPLENLGHDWIARQRHKLFQWYSRSGYLHKNLDDLISTIVLVGRCNPSQQPPTALWVAKKSGNLTNNVVAYTQEWLALVSAFDGLEKGFEIGADELEPFVKEKRPGMLTRLDDGVHLYKIQTGGMVPDRESVYKWLAKSEPRVINKRYVHNVLERLRDQQVRLVKC